MFFADGIAHLDGPVESLEPLPDFFHSGQRLALRRVGADEASEVDDEALDRGDLAPLHPFDAPVALGLQQGVEQVDVPFGTDLGRRGLWTFPRAHGDVGDMAGGDGVEGQAFAQVVGGVEPPVRDAGPGFEGFEPCLDGPPFPVPVQDGGGVDGVGFPLRRALGGQQQPVQRLRAVGGVGLGGGDGAHGQRFRVLPLLPRRQERDLRRPDFQAGGALFSGPRASGGRDHQLRHGERGQGCGVRPQAPLPPVRCPHPPLRRSAGAHQDRVAVRRRTGEQRPEVALAVAHGDHPRVRAGGREFPRPVQPVHPAGAVFLRGVAEVRVHGEQAQRAALRRHRQPGVGEDANAAPAATAEFRQALRRLQAGVVQGRGVLDGQHDGRAAAAVGGRRDMRLQNVIHGHPRVRQQPVRGRFGRRHREDDR